MGATGSVAGIVPTAPGDVFTFLTGLDRLPDWNAIMTGLVDRAGTVDAAADRGSQVTVSWDLNPVTFSRRVLLARIRPRQLRRVVPAAIDSLVRVLREASV